MSIMTVSESSGVKYCVVGILLISVKKTWIPSSTLELTKSMIFVEMKNRVSLRVRQSERSLLMIIKYLLVIFHGFGSFFLKAL